MTKVWVLVLLMGGGGHYKNPEVGMIEGFTSRDECLEAGRQISDISVLKVKFTCVKR